VYQQQQQQQEEQQQDAENPFFDPPFSRIKSFHVKLKFTAQEEKLPKVIVTQTNFNSATFSFDHFAPDDYMHGYVAMYKMVDGGRWQTREQDSTERAQNFDLPSVTIANLRPDTSYMARIAVYDDYSLRSLGKSTAVLEFKTECKTTNINY
jgi:hypothetical protein